jgi:hypothetical protein
VSLPDLPWQILYGRLAWTLVLAALALALLPAAWRRARGVLAGMLGGLAALNFLPGEGAPSFWLGLAFQLPSAFLAALCAGRLLLLWRGRQQVAVLPLILAVPLALLGSVLYLDAIGLLALGWYYAGFGPQGAPVVASVLAMFCAWAIMRGRLRPYAVALLVAMCVFALLRLPTGNIWDAVLDPFLVLWAVVSVPITLWRWKRASRQRARIKA